MGQYNLEVMPAEDASDEIPAPGKSFNAFPAPLSMCGVFVREKSAFGLARGMIRDINDWRVSCGTPSNPRNFTLQALIDATGSGQFDSFGPDDPYFVGKFSDNRRSNLAASLMIMPPYFHATTRAVRREEWGRSGGVGDYAYSSGSDIVSPRTLYDWSIDPNPYFASFNEEEEGTTTYSGSAFILAYMDAGYIGSMVQFFGMSRLVNNTGLNYDIREDRDWFLAFNGADDDPTLLQAISRELAPLDSIPVSAPGSRPEGSLELMDPAEFQQWVSHTAVSAIGYPSWGFTYDYGQDDPIVVTFYHHFTLPSDTSHAVSESEFSSRFPCSESTHSFYVDEERTWEESFEDYYKWYGHVFDPSPDFSWSRQVPLRHIW